LRPEPEASISPGSGNCSLCFSNLMNSQSIQNRIKADPYNPRLYLELAEVYLDEGNEGKARDIVVRRRNMPSDDPVIHRNWAVLCEEFGMARQAIESYQRALKLAPRDTDALYRLALLFADIGHYEKSIRYLKKTIKYDPDHQEAKRLLADDYRAIGLEGSAEVLEPKAKKLTPGTPPRYFTPPITDEHTGIFLNLFAGREIGYAVQEVDPTTGQISYSYCEAPLTHDLIASHLLGEITLAGYPLRSDNTEQYAALSVNIQPGVLEDNLKNKGYLAYLKEKTKDHVLALSRCAQQLNLPAYPEDTGWYEYRLWFFFRNPTHFLKIKRFITAFLEKVPLPDGNLTVEPVLATKPVGIGWVERPTMLPLGVHKATLYRSLFLDSDGRPEGEQLKYLKKIRKITPKAIQERCRTRSVSVIGLDARMEGMPYPVSTLAGKCAIVKELIHKAFAGRVLRREEKVILFYTVGIADRDGDSLHSILENCPDYHYVKVERQFQRLQPNPISCLKIRELIPELTASVGCNCAFDLRGGKYPSPLLHVNPHLVPAAEEFLPAANLPVREVARRYVNLRRQSEEIKRAMMRLESVLDRQFSKKKIDHIKLRDIKVRRITEKDHTRWELERC